MNKQQATFDDFFSECYLKYKEYIKNYIAIRICHPHEAEDLAQVSLSAYGNTGHS